MPLSPDLALGLTVLAAGLAVLYVGFVVAGVRGRLRAIKPLPAMLLALVHPDLAPVLLAWAVGDAFLLDKDRFFLHGLGAFLVGHLAYIAILAATSGVDWRAVGVGLLIAGTVLSRLWHGLKPKLRAPVVLYALALAGMLGVALPAGTLPGVVMMLVSDTILAWNRFRTPLPRGDVLVMVTYYGAVFLVAGAVPGL